MKLSKFEEELLKTHANKKKGNQKKTLEELVLEVLSASDEPLTVQDISGKIAKPESSVVSVVYKLRTKSEIRTVGSKKVGDGRGRAFKTYTVTDK